MDRRHDLLRQRANERMASFDEDWPEMRRGSARAARWAVVWIILSALLGLASLSFIVWIVVVLLRFIGAL